MEHYKRNLERVAAAAVDTLTAQAAAQPQNWQVLMQLGKVHAAAGNGSASQAAVWAAVRRQNSVQFHAASTTALYQSRLVRTVCGCSGPVAQAMLSGRWWAACVGVEAGVQAEHRNLLQHVRARLVGILGPALARSRCWRWRQRGSRDPPCPSDCGARQVRLAAVYGDTIATLQPHLVCPCVIVASFHVEVYADVRDADIGTAADGVVWYPLEWYNVNHPPDVFVGWRYSISAALGWSARRVHMWMHVSAVCSFVCLWKCSSQLA